MQQGVIESCGVTAASFELLAGHIGAIIGAWDTDVPEVVLSLLDAVHDARAMASEAADYIDRAEPFPFFCTRLPKLCEYNYKRDRLLLERLGVITFMPLSAH